MEPLVLTLAHSPDADDAFMFWALARGKVSSPRVRLEHQLKDIESLNRDAQQGVYDITALSVASIPLVADRYEVMDAGASVGDGYGPIVVAREPRSMDSLRGRRVAVPGLRTTAAATLGLALPDAETVEISFDDVGPAVLDGKVDAGVIIHEGQLTYGESGLHLVLDLGRWWRDETGLPLPLGVNVIRKSLPPEVKDAAGMLLRESISCGLDHREEALDYALGFGRGLARDMADRFVGMYVNDWTLSLGERGHEALRRLLGAIESRASSAGGPPGGA